MYFAVPVELYPVFVDLKNLAKNSGQQSDQKSNQNLIKIWPKSGQNLAQNPGTPTMYSKTWL